MTNRDFASAIQTVRSELWAGRLDAAFEVAESLLDTEPEAEGYDALIDLLGPTPQGGSADALTGLLRRIEGDPTTKHAPWRCYVRFLALWKLHSFGEAFAVSAELTHLRPRYGWMRFERAALLLSQLSAYDEAIREYEHVRQTAPRIWKADARLAETELCRGREAEGFAVLDACIAELGRDPRGAHRVEGALAWRGELRLWMGRYEEGLADLDRAANHDHPFALGWRGAAHLLLGDPARAIADLDRALARNSNDTESLIWRGEARARTERRDEALADFDRAARQGSPLWALIGRALIKAHLGDAAGFYTDYDRLYTPEIGFFRAKPCVPTARDLPADAAWLDAVRKDAHGLRRAEVWLRPLWMKRWRDSAA